MFDDLQWHAPRRGRYQEWKRAALKLLKESGRRLAIIEVGAGDRIPTVRHNGENLLQHLYEHAALWEDARNTESSSVKAKLIRINPDFPKINRVAMKHLDPFVISIESGGLFALDAIQKAMQK